MKSWFFGQAGVLVVVLTAAGVATQSSARADWHIETVDSAGNVGSCASLAVDADGNPHVAYFDSTNIHLKYAKRVGGAWQTEVVPGAPSSYPYPSLALDSQGRPHIAYSGNGLYYTHWTGTEWQSTYVSGQPAALRIPSLALTAADEPCIAAFMHTDNGDSLWYAAPDGPSWSWTHVVGSGYGCCGGTPALVLDANDNPRIGWGYAGYFVYSWSDGADWTSEWLGSNVDERTVSLALDSADEAHVSYTDTGYNLIYGRRTNSVWSFETVVSAGATGSLSSLALDAYDRPHIAYDLGGYPPHPLKYAHRTTSSWCVQTLEDTGYIVDPSIAADPDGNPRIAYYDGTNLDLKYAWWEPSVVTGDLNCDGCVGFGDINPFVQFLANFNAWQATYPNCPPENGDINGDGSYPSFGDINPFVALLTGGG